MTKTLEDYHQIFFRDEPITQKLKQLENFSTLEKLRNEFEKNIKWEGEPKYVFPGAVIRYNLKEEQFEFYMVIYNLNESIDLYKIINKDFHSVSLEELDKYIKTLNFCTRMFPSGTPFYDKNKVMDMFIHDIFFQISVFVGILTGEKYLKYNGEA